MTRPLTAILLAGRIRPSPLREALDIPVLCLPIGRRGSLLDAWLTLLASVPGLTEVQVVVNSPGDADAVRTAAGSSHALESCGASLRVIAEPAAWRGAGGIVRDVSIGVDSSSIVLVCEAKRLPPATLAPMFVPYDTDPDISGVVGLCGLDEPAGVYTFSRQALDLVPRIGYFDLKEQFLPAMANEERRVLTARLGDWVHRIRDVNSYLGAVRQSMMIEGAEQSAIRIAPRASVSGSAVLDGVCVVEHGGVVEDGAVVHDSVILWGATVGGGSVVSGSVIGPLAVVEPRTRVIRSVVTRSMPQSVPSMVEVGGSSTGGRDTW